MSVSALQNGVRRRVNRLAREGMTQLRAQLALNNPRFTSSLSAQDKAAVAAIASGLTSGWPKKLPPRRKPLAKGEAKTMSRRTATSKEKALRRLLKMSIAKDLKIPTKRMTKGKARHFKSKNKKAAGRAFGRAAVVVNVEGVREYNAASVSRRAQGLPGHGLALYGSARGKGKTKGKFEQQLFRAGYVPAVKGAKRVGGQKASPAQLAGLAKGRAKRAAKLAAKRGEGIGSLAMDNVSALGGMGDLAFTNPSMGVGSYLLGYALPVTVAGAVAGGVHGLASSTGMTGKLADAVAMIPGIGPMIAETVPYTLQGLLVGSVLALAGGAIGGSAGKYIALAGGATLVLGGGIDAFNLALGGSESSPDDEDISSGIDAELSGLEEPSAMGDLAFTNGVGRGPVPFGSVAFTNGVSALGRRQNLGDGFAFEIAPLTASPDGNADYGQAMLADAEFCGADFSVAEGQALLNGRQAFLNAFGNPTHRVAKAELRASQHAGREGHRWGWLIKVVGWERAKNIAGMTAQHRVVIIHRIRKAALDAYGKSVAEWQARQGVSQVPSAPAAGSVATGAEGAAGVASPNGGQTNYLGEPALFMGA